VTDLRAETINERIEVTTDDDLAAKLAAAEAGDVLVLQSGTHTVSETLRRDVDNVSIVGQGKFNTTIEVESGPALQLIGTNREPGGGERRRGWFLSDLVLSMGDGDRLLEARYADGLQAVRVHFAGWNIPQKIYAEECWDWRLNDCLFGHSGAGSMEHGAAIYAYNGDQDNTNNFHFVNCRWEPVGGHAIYSDISGEGNRNGRFYLHNCKFHGGPPQGEEWSDHYYIDGGWSTLKLNNCTFLHGNRGHVRQAPVEKNANTVQIVNCNFRGYGDSALAIHQKENYVANNSFWSNEGGAAIHLAPGAYESTVVGNVTGGSDPSVLVEAPRCTVVGNVIDFDDYMDDSTHTGVTGVTVRGNYTTVGNNVVKAAGDAGIRFDGATHCTAVGNVVRSAAGSGIVAGEEDAILVNSNVVSGSDGGIDAPAATVGTNLVE
jgi:hypothetical protein